MNDKIKAMVFFDLDGTLLTSGKKVAKDSYRAIQKLKRNHILPVICTGRNIFLVHNIMLQAGIDSAICGNGNYIVYHGKQIFKSHIKANLINKLLKMAHEFKDPIAFQTHDEVVLNSSNRLTVLEYKYKHHTSPAIDKNYYKTHHLVGCNIFTLHHDKDYQKAFKGQLSIVRNSDLCLDVQSFGINKGFGVNVLRKHLNLPNIPTYAFGDGRNDAPMIKTATYGIAMGNGWKFDKEHAQYVTTDNDHHGIVNGLKHYHLI